MAFRDLLVVVDSSKASHDRIELAASLAAEHDAHLVGLYILPIPEERHHHRPTLVDAIIDLCIREEKELAQEARRQFEEAVGRNSIQAEWRTGGGFPSDEAAVHSRYADLAIVGQLDTSMRGRIMPPLVPEEIAFSAGRPVLVTPVSGTPKKIGRRVIVAWNAKREAARAVNDAIPILVKAESVVVLVINPENSPRTSNTVFVATRISPSATLPKIKRRTPRLPCVPITIKSAGQSPPSFVIAS
jgi:nucleotide-binding universal stress UspA family protein